MDNQDKDKAKAIIVEIIRENGGHLHNKTALFKAFWKSHVDAAGAGHTLSVYPIVHMPKGPGIDRFDQLLGELMAEGVLSTEMADGPYPAFHFHLDEPDAYQERLSDADLQAIRTGVEFVQGCTAAEISESSHELSRSWRSTKDGEEIDVDLDAIPEEEYREMKARMKARKEALEATT